MTTAQQKFGARRDEALAALRAGAQGDARNAALEVLVKELFGAVNAWTEAWAADPSTVALLAPWMGDADPLTSEQSIMALGRIVVSYAKTPALAALLAPWSEHPSPKARRVVLEALCAAGDDAAWSRITPRLGDDDAAVRATALHCVARWMLAGREVPAAHLRAMRDGAVERLDDRAVDVRVAAASALQRIGDASSLPALKAAAKKTKNAQERDALRHALKAAGAR
jgi:HEAT repeat protein